MISKTIVLSDADISKRVKELGMEISRNFRKKELLVIGVLNGAFIFTADLVRRISIPVKIDFIRVASYGNETSPSPNISLTKKNEIPIASQDILLVEDIVDTGRTTAWLKEYFQKQTSGSISICALIDKKERREKEITIDYTGFQIPRGFLIGYGLDYAEEFRHYPDIYHLED